MFNVYKEWSNTFGQTDVGMHTASGVEKIASFKEANDAIEWVVKTMPHGNRAAVLEKDGKHVHQIRDVKNDMAAAAAAVLTGGVLTIGWGSTTAFVVSREEVQEEKHITFDKENLAYQRTLLGR